MNVVFFNVDTQYDFMRDDETHKGALPVPGARDIEGKLEELTKFAAEHRLKVVNTADWHIEDSFEISDKPDYKTTFPPHCMQNTKGALYVPATDPENPYVIDWQESILDEDKVQSHRNLVLLKDEFSVFTGSPHTERVLELIKPTVAVVYGVATNVCVHYAVMGLRQHDIAVRVPIDAIQELPNLPLEYTLLAWRKIGVQLTDTHAILRELG
jgi:nicotinamidase/pyrazinamidase